MTCKRTLKALAVLLTLCTSPALLPASEARKDKCYRDGDQITVKGRTAPAPGSSYIEPSAPLCARDPKSGKDLKIMRLIPVGRQLASSQDVEVTGKLRHSTRMPPQYLEIVIQEVRDLRKTEDVPAAERTVIAGAFGIKFGDDIRPHLEGHYSNLSRVVEGKPYLSLGNKLTYMLLRPPVDMQQMFPNSRIDYLGIPNEHWQTTELLLKVSVRPACSRRAQEVDAVMSFLRSKYEVTAAQKVGYSIGERYGDGDNEIELKCDRDELSIRYTSRLFTEYVDKLAADAQHQKEKLKDSLKEAM